MHNLSMCRICLATDIRLCSVASHLRDMFERISSITFNREDRRPLVACYICHARLQNCYRLRTSCLRSEELLTEMVSSVVVRDLSCFVCPRFKSQAMLGTNSLSVVSVLQLSLGDVLKNSTECNVQEETLQVNCDAELSQHSTEDIKMEPQEYDVQIDDNNQCLHLEESLDVIKTEPDDDDTDVADIKSEMEDITIEENEISAYQSYLSAYNIRPTVVEVELERAIPNDATLESGARVSRRSRIGALNGIEETKESKEIENLTIKEPKIETKEKPTTSGLLEETCDKLDVSLYTYENVVTSVDDICEDKSTNNTSSKRNVSSKSKSKNKKFSCDICKKCFKNKTHTRIHTGEKPYQCHVCKACFSMKNNLQRHIRIHTGTHKCNICKICFNDKDILKKHIRMHTDNSPYQCGVCKKSFNSKYVLKNHIRTHTGDKPYKCNVCRKSFGQKSGLDKHIRIHTGEKAYECIVCKRYFGRKCDLKEHVRTHTGEKPYQCTICKKCFAVKSSLSKHIRTHTGEKPYRCNYCEKCFSDLSNYTKHSRIHLR